MSTTLSITASSGFYEKTIIRLLSKMEKGTLLITLPSGQEITIGNGGGSITASMSIKDPYFFKRCVLYGDVGFGEAYVEGEWDTDNIQNVIKWFLLNIENAPGVSGSKRQGFFVNILKFLNTFYHSKRINSVGGSRKTFQNITTLIMLFSLCF